MSMFVKELHDLKHCLELCKNTALNDDLKQLFQDELDLLSKAANDNTLKVEYVEGCRYRIDRTLGMMRVE